jgi:DNA end-binding protein Ku
MASTVWKGLLNFGLLAMPVHFTTAASEKTIMFNQLHSKCKSRLKQVMTCTVCNAPVEKAEMVKGHEHVTNEYVAVSADEISELKPETADCMEVLEFVHAQEMDPVFFEKSYHLAPDAGGEQAYALLFETMRKSGLVAVTKISMHQREHVAVLRPGARGIILQTLFYHDEVRGINEFRTDSSLVKSAEIAMAAKLAESMATTWNPLKYSDSYREKLAELIKAKIEGKTIAKGVKNGRKSGTVPDLAQALKRSLQLVKKRDAKA